MSQLKDENPHHSLGKNTSNLLDRLWMSVRTREVIIINTKNRAIDGSESPDEPENIC
jgi:hypothetical protein